MNRIILTLIGTLVLTLLSSASALAASPDELLRDVHGVLRITGANIQWRPNGIGGLAPTLVHDVTNRTAFSVLIPVTVLGRQAANWAGSRQYWIERLDRDATIPAMPRGTARRGRQYAYGGFAIQWPGQEIVGRGFIRFEQPIAIGGFPSGRYALTIEYSETHRNRLIQSEVVYFVVP